MAHCWLKWNLTVQNMVRYPKLDKRGGGSILRLCYFIYLIRIFLDYYWSDPATWHPAWNFFSWKFSKISWQKRSARKVHFPPSGHTVFRLWLTVKRQFFGSRWPHLTPSDPGHVTRNNLWRLFPSSKVNFFVVSILTRKV